MGQGALEPAEIVVARAGSVDPDLHELLGSQRSASLQRLLAARALAWARELAPGRVRQADDVTPEVYPVLVVWPVLAVWRAEHALGALDDLADGCQVSVGPVFDGGLYLLALAGLTPWLGELAGGAWSGPETLGRMFAGAAQASHAVGMLRAERALRRPADVRAAWSDPLLDPELRTLLALD